MSKADENSSELAEETPVVAVPDSENDAPGVADLDSITEQLGDASPVPNDAAINADAEKKVEKQAEYSELRDGRGNRFDPEMHVTDKEGEPILTKLKKLRLKSGRKRGGENTQGLKKPGQVLQGDGTLSAAEKLQARATGEAAANALIMLGVVVGGDEWNPITDEIHGLNEKQNLSHAFGDYFEAKEMTDIPPGVALTIAISAYMLPRFTMPQTQTRMQKFKEWVATKIAKRRVRKNSNGSQSNTGNDGKRENDAGEKVSE